MLDNIIIKDVIENNLKINEIIPDNNKNDNSFNQLLSLQLLIQKQSGLKELCKQIIQLKKNICIYSYKRKGRCFKKNK